MTKPLILHAERLMPANADVRAIAIRLYRSVKTYRLSVPMATRIPRGSLTTNLLVMPLSF